MSYKKIVKHYKKHKKGDSDKIKFLLVHYGEPNSSVFDLNYSVSINEMDIEELELQSKILASSFHDFKPVTSALYLVFNGVPIFKTLLWDEESYKETNKKVNKDERMSDEEIKEKAGFHFLPVHAEERFMFTNMLKGVNLEHLLAL